MKLIVITCILSAYLSISQVLLEPNGPRNTYSEITAVLAPNYSPIGGVSPTEENLKGWFDAGVTCVGMGSQLMAKHADGSFDYAKIEAQTRNALEIISSLR